MIGPAVAAALLFAFAVDDDPAVAHAQKFYDAGKWADTVAVWRSLQFGPTGWCHIGDPPPCRHGPDSFAVTMTLRSRDTLVSFRRLP